MDYRTLVDVGTLAAHLRDPEWVVFDCRHDLSDVDAGRRAYTHSHLPGARFLHLDHDMAAPKNGSNGRHPLPDPAAFAARLSALGMARSKQLVAYDASGGIYAARLWWMLRWLGHERVAVLDGGWDAWVQSDQAVTAEPPLIVPASFTPADQSGSVDTAFVRSHLDSPAMRLIDARSAERFRGIGETLDPVGGHIPGAVNHFYKDNLGPDGRFKLPHELRQIYAPKIGAYDPRQIVHQCGSGVTACHNLLAMESAGLSGSRLYAGSWSEWCSDPSRPLSRD